VLIQPKSSAELAKNIVALAGQLARNKDRLLCYAATFDDYVAASAGVRNRADNRRRAS
jgi:hypothetical protein